MTPACAVAPRVAALGSKRRHMVHMPRDPASRPSCGHANVCPQIMSINGVPAISELSPLCAARAWSSSDAAVPLSVTTMDGPILTGARAVLRMLCRAVMRACSCTCARMHACLCVLRVSMCVRVRMRACVRAFGCVCVRMTPVPARPAARFGRCAYGLGQAGGVAVLWASFSRPAQQLLLLQAARCRHRDWFVCSNEGRSRTHAAGHPLQSMHASQAWGRCAPGRLPTWLRARPWDAIVICLARMTKERMLLGLSHSHAMTGGAASGAACWGHVRARALTHTHTRVHTRVRSHPAPPAYARRDSGHA